MKGIVIIISAVLFVALMLTSCRNYYNMVEPDEESLAMTKAKPDSEPRESSRTKTFGAESGSGGSSLNPFQVDLIAAGGGGEGLDLGDVQVWNDAENIYVKYQMVEGDWCLTKTAVEVAGAPDGIAQAVGNPIIGKFTWKAQLGSVREYTEVIPLQTEPGIPVCIAAYARVIRASDPDVAEGSWGEGRDFPGHNWAMYFMYRIAYTASGSAGDPPASDDL